MLEHLKPVFVLVAESLQKTEAHKTSICPNFRLNAKINAKFWTSYIDGLRKAGDAPGHKIVVAVCVCVFVVVVVVVFFFLLLLLLLSLSSSSC